MKYIISGNGENNEQLIKLFYNFLVSKGLLFTFLNCTTYRSLEELDRGLSPQHYIWGGIHSFHATEQGFDFWIRISEEWEDMVTNYSNEAN